MTMNNFLQTLGIALLLSAASLPTGAGDGHEHGETPAAGKASAAPRFVAVSETFELVGILNDRKIALYLDRAADNSPVTAARLELDVGGSQVPVAAVGDGEFEATLAAAPAPGVIPVTATVVAGDESDLLAGQLDIHADPHAPERTMAVPWKALAGVVAGLLAVAAWWRSRRARQVGGAA